MVPEEGVVPVASGSEESYQFCNVTDAVVRFVEGVNGTFLYWYICPDVVSI